MGEHSARIVRMGNKRRILVTTRETMYVHVILRRHHETTVAVDKQKVLHIFLCVRPRGCACVRVCVSGCTVAVMFLRTCSLTCPECNAQAPYCHLPPL
jgi:hypothetical protein